MKGLVVSMADDFAAPLDDILKNAAKSA